MMTTVDQPTTSPLKAWHHLLIFAAAFAVLVTRRPDAIFHAQFWAEDGHAWFADAYNFGGFHALSRAQDGYFQTLPRLASWLALFVPLSVAPLILNIVAIGVRAFPANLLLSERAAGWGSLRFRAMLAGLYLVLPNEREMDGVITSSQWVLAFCALLLLISATPKTRAGRIFDVAFLSLCGLTGPFCAFLLPVALFLSWKRREVWRYGQTAILGICCFVQAWGLLFVNPTARTHYAAAGATPALFARIVAGQVYLSTLLGSNGLDAIPGRGILIFFVCVVVAGTAILALCFVKAPIEMKLVIAFSVALFAASMASPNCGAPRGVSAWEMLTGGGGNRYWFFPTIAFAWSILWLFHTRRRWMRTLAAPLLLVMCFGIVRDYEHPAFADLHYADDAKRVEAAPTGSTVTIPENPPGWNVRLIKRASTHR